MSLFVLDSLIWSLANLREAKPQENADLGAEMVNFCKSFISEMGNTLDQDCSLLFSTGHRLSSNFMNLHSDSWFFETYKFQKRTKKLVSQFKKQELRRASFAPRVNTAVAKVKLFLFISRNYFNFLLWKLT